MDRCAATVMHLQLKGCANILDMQSHKMSVICRWFVFMYTPTTAFYIGNKCGLRTLLSHSHCTRMREWISVCVCVSSLASRTSQCTKMYTFSLCPRILSIPTIRMRHYLEISMLCRVRINIPFSIKALCMNRHFFLFLSAFNLDKLDDERFYWRNVHVQPHTYTHNEWKAHEKWWKRSA